MGRHLVWISSLAALVLTSGPVSGREPPGKEAASPDVQALVGKIDQILAARWAEAKVEPAPLASDAEFMRRVYLDVAGRIPSVAEARTFLEDKRPDKRARLVNQLLAGSSYVAHMTNVWRALLLPEAGNNFQVRLQQGSFDNWLKKQVARNAGYDQMARELLTAPVGGTGGLGGIAGLLGNSGPLTFYLAKEFKPESLASSTARVFLGVSVGCAECHDHPFAEWKRDQFWGLAAFYSGITSQRQMDFLLPGREDPKKREITIPGTEKVIRARFIDGTEPVANAKASRTALADWLTAPSNPYFARAEVNRAWAYYLGTGLVEPIDEMVGASSMKNQPELLDLLAREFTEHQFDMKFLIRVITATRAYQLSSTGKNKGPEERALFARMPLRGLSGEQLFDSVAMATGYRDSGGDDDLISGLLGGNRSARSEFLTKFAQSERSTETQTSILQALTLMNGKVIARATALEHSETLAAVADAPFLTTAERIETLYLATLSRKPQPKELDRAVRFVEDAGKGKDVEAAAGNALADVFWALLNSPEFILNH
jgi:Protein of unknown function (DUF1549)/Protein of unknown function (DUF1553)